MLKGRYVTLEPLSITHAEPLFAIARHTERERLFRFLFDVPPDTIDAQREWIRLQGLSSDPLFFVCADVSDQRVLGRQALMRITPAHGVIEIGNILWGPEMARSRIATESMYLMARYIFEELGYRRFEWKCDADNLPSRRAAERFGFRFEGMFAQHMWVKGRNRDTAWYAMLDRDWMVQRSVYEAWLAPANFGDRGTQVKTLEACRLPAV